MNWLVPSLQTGLTTAMAEASTDVVDDCDSESRIMWLKLFSPSHHPRFYPDDQWVLSPGFPLDFLTIKAQKYPSVVSMLEVQQTNCGLVEYIKSLQIILILDTTL